MIVFSRNETDHQKLIISFLVDTGNAYFSGGALGEIEFYFLLKTLAATVEKVSIIMIGNIRRVYRLRGTIGMYRINIIKIGI